MSVVHGLIFDLGMNNGDDTVYYLATGNHVVAVEANPHLVQQGEIRFAREIKAGFLQILNAGIASEEGYADFWVCGTHPQFSSFNRESASRYNLEHYRVRVPTIRLQTLFSNYGVPNYLKIDIEGNELLCIDELSPKCLPRYVSAECDSFHHTRGVDPGLKILYKLHKLGYTGFKFINQFTFCAVTDPCSFAVRLDSIARKVLSSYLKRVPGVYRSFSPFLIRGRLERRLNREFPLGASGPWGKDTHGKWISFSEAEKTYARYKRADLHKKDHLPFLFWYDWHARL